GVIHRDLKPGNVMLAPSGMVKVLDFGLARSTRGSTGPIALPTFAPTVESDRAAPVPPDESVATTPLGDHSEAWGTPGYMSPEQVRGEPQDGRSDVFAFGCLLYESLVGTRAFEGDTAEERTAAVLDREPEWERLPERASGRLRDLLVRCCEKDPERRP